MSQSPSPREGGQLARDLRVALSLLNTQHRDVDTERRLHAALHSVVRDEHFRRPIVKHDARKFAGELKKEKAARKDSLRLAGVSPPRPQRNERTSLPKPATGWARDDGSDRNPLGDAVLEYARVVALIRALDDARTLQEKWKGTIVAPYRPASLAWPRFLDWLLTAFRREYLTELVPDHNELDRPRKRDVAAKVRKRSDVRPRPMASPERQVQPGPIRWVKNGVEREVPADHFGPLPNVDAPVRRKPMFSLDALIEHVESVGSDMPDLHAYGETVAAMPLEETVTNKVTASQQLQELARKLGLNKTERRFYLLKAQGHTTASAARMMGVDPTTARVLDYRVQQRL